MSVSCQAYTWARRGGSGPSMIRLPKNALKKRRSFWACFPPKTVLIVKKPYIQLKTAPKAKNFCDIVSFIVKNASKFQFLGPDDTVGCLFLAHDTVGWGGEAPPPCPSMTFQLISFRGLGQMKISAFHFPFYQFSNQPRYA